MNVWDKFNKLTKLDFTYEDVTPGVIPEIYANTRNQIGIVISIGVNGIDGKPLNLKEDDFKDLLYFCDPITGERISSPWNMSDKKNEYTKAVKHSSHNITKRDTTSGFTYVHRYISCSESKITKNFSLGINIPGIGDFNTSNDGTNTPNSPKGESGSPFKSPKSLTISTLHPINYSIPSEIKFEAGWKNYDDLRHIVKDMRFEVREKWGENSPSIYNDGVSSYSYILIRPINPKYQFKEKIVRRNLDKMEGMKIHGYTNGCADIIRSVSGVRNYDMSLIFVDSERYGVNPASYFEVARTSAIYRYVFGENDTRHKLSDFPSYYPIPKLDEDYILIVISNYRIPDKDLQAYGRLETPSNGKISVDVTDTYGNAGVIYISLENDDWPRLRVNGKLT